MSEPGEIVAVTSHGELDRLRETVDVLSDSELVRAIHEGLADVSAGRMISADEIAADLRARSGGF